MNLCPLSHEVTRNVTMNGARDGLAVKGAAIPTADQNLASTNK